MATEVVHVVDPDNGSGADYTTITAWEAAQQRDLTSADEIAVAKCRCTGSTGDAISIMYISGWTTDATRYIKIWTDPTESYRHSGKWSTGNVYRIEATKTGSSQAIIDVQEDFVQFVGLLMQSDNGGQLHAKGINFQNSVADGSEFLVDSCIIRALHSGASSYANGIDCTYVSTGGNRTLKVQNTLVYDFSESNADCGGIVQTYGWNVLSYNNTVHNCWDGIYCGNNASNYHVVKNCIVQDCTETCYGGTFHADSDYNCSDDGTHPGSNGQTGEVTFVDEANDDFHLNSTDSVALGNGLDLSSDASNPISVDIDGDARTSWDIGADEFLMAAGTFYEMWELGQAPQIYNSEGGVDGAMAEGSLGDQKVKIFVETLNTSEQTYEDS